MPAFWIPFRTEYSLEELIQRFAQVVAGRFPVVANDLRDQSSVLIAYVEAKGLVQEEAAPLIFEFIQKLPSYADLEVEDQIEVGVLFEVHVGQHVFC